VAFGAGLGSKRVISYHCEACPAGRFGAHPWLRSPACSGPCRPGHWCPPGSSSPKPFECGGVGLFCPEGAAAPVPVSAGFYTVTESANNLTTPSSDRESFESTGGESRLAGLVVVSPSEAALPGGLGRADGPGGGGGVPGPVRASVGSWEATRTGQRECGPGTFCLGGVAFLCPQGTFGSGVGLSSEECSGLCFAGSFCPLGSKEPSVCPVGNYCPSGDRRWPCPPGTAGNETGLASPSCSGLCPPGTYCPAGSLAPRRCPGGTYGQTRGLPSPACSGPCPEGFFCPEGAAQPRKDECGGPGVYCPRGSPAPVAVSEGFYSAGGETARTMVRQAECEPGHFCAGGVRHVCRAGTYNSEFGLAADPASLGLDAGEGALAFWCQGFCARGHWCAPGATSPVQSPCPAGTYGAREGLGNASCSGPCARGHYCPPGSRAANEVPCPAGRFGNQTGLTSSACSANCGLHALSLQLGPDARAAHLASHLGSGGATRDHRGSYGDYGGALRHPPYDLEASAFEVEAGLASPFRELGPEPGRQPHWGGAGSSWPGSSGGADPSGFAAWAGAAEDAFFCLPSVCHEGYWCPNASVTGKERECGGAGVYCPWGSAEPVKVRPGYYSTGGSGPTTRTGERECEAGSFCVRGVRRKCPAGVFGSSPGLTSKACDGPCAPGHYCPEGSTSEFQMRCPAGRFGAPVDDAGSVVATNNGPAGQNFAPSNLDPLSPSLEKPVRLNPGLRSPRCTGRCAPGFFCPEASTSPFERVCGSDRVYCPEGSGRPVQVRRGYYSTGGANATVREGQLQCGEGSYCAHGIKYDCPAGAFGSSRGLSSATCSGLCERGHWCPAGSASPLERPCPVGRFGATRGLGSSKCSGACPRAYECREGSTDQFGHRVVNGDS